MNPPPGSTDPDDDGDEPTFPDGPSLGELFHDLDETELEEIRRAVAGLGASGAAEGRRFLASLGPFRDLEEVGRGGMGVVYRAYDPASGRLVAVKVPSVGLTSKGARKRFRREIEALRSLDHPAVVRWLGVGEDGDRSYLVIEYCDGPTLSEWLRARKDAVPPREAARIVAVLADAVEHSHARDLLHRDIKPSNVLLPGAKPDSEPEALSPRLSDFGLAKLLTRSDGEAPPEVAGTITQGLLGSPPYMAPELAGVGLGAAGTSTDVYGLGAILYETLTGRPPFRGQGLSETLRMIVHDEPVPVRVLSPGVPKPLETIALKCLEKAPGDRFGTAAELRDDLRRFLDGRPILARPPRPAVRLRRWRRRHPRVAFAGTATLAVLALVFAASAAWNVSLRRLNEDLRRANGEAVRLNAELTRARDQAEADRRRAEVQNYDSRVHRAHRALDDGQVALAQQILADLIPGQTQDDHREFAWRHLWYKATREATPLPGIVNGLDFCALSRDGRRLAVVSRNWDANYGAYDLEEGRYLWKSPLEHGIDPALVTFSEDGRYLALGRMVPMGEKSRWLLHIEVRDVATGSLLADFSEEAAVALRTLAFVEGGRMLAAVFSRHTDASPKDVSLCRWDWRRGGIDRPEFDGRFKWAAASIDGRLHVAFRPDGDLGVFDVSTLSWTACRVEGVSDLSYAKFDPVAGSFAVLSRGGRRVSTFEVATGRKLVDIPDVQVDLRGLEVRPGGEALVLLLPKQEVRFVAPDQHVDVQLHAPTEAPGVSMGRTAFLPGGSGLVSWRSEYRGPVHVELRSASDGSIRGESPILLPQALEGAWTSSHNDRFLIYGIGRHAWSWDWAKTLEPDREDILRAHRDEVWSVCYSPDGKILATASNNDVETETIKLWDTRSGGLIRSWTAHASTVSDLAFSPDGSLLASGSLAVANSVRLWEVSTGRRLAEFELEGEETVRSVEFDPIGRRLYVGGNWGTLLAWDVADRRSRWTAVAAPESRRKGSKERIHDLSSSPDGTRLASADDHGRVRIRDAGSGQILAEYGVGGSTYDVVHSPDGRTLAVADREGEILLLDAVTAEPLRTIHGDDVELRALAFSPDGRTLAAAGLGRVVRLWEADTGDELAALEGHEAQINSLVFSPDGATLTSADHAGVVRFWRTRPDAPR